MADAARIALVVTTTGRGELCNFAVAATKRHSDSGLSMKSYHCRKQDEERSQHASA